MGEFRFIGYINRGDGGEIKVYSNKEEKYVDVDITGELDDASICLNSQHLSALIELLKIAQGDLSESSKLSG